MCALNETTSQDGLYSAVDEMRVWPLTGTYRHIRKPPLGVNMVLGGIEGKGKKFFKRIR